MMSKFQLLILIFCICTINSDLPTCQTKNNNLCASLYYSVSKFSKSTFAPVITYYKIPDQNSIYFEARINYDDIDVLSIYGGYCIAFETKDNTFIEIVPTLVTYLSYLKVFLQQFILYLQ
ncbi:MAG: hypothetical protein IPO16_09845 [Saprospiraceae bacterium]|nr:hypothetical protein [Saprospiraceae bacterium]